MGNLSTGQQLAAMHHLELAFLQDVAPKYLSHATPPHGLKIREWKNRSAVPLINRLHSGISGLKRQCAQVLDHELVWLEGGNPLGTPVVLLHGFASNKENWLSLAPFLLKKHRLFILDLPGWGESQFNANVPYGLDDQVERVAAWLMTHVPGKVHLVGNSVGGLVSALLAGRHPDLLQSLCLMNPAGGKGEDHTLFEAGLREGKNPMIVENYAGAHTFMNLVVHSKAIALALAPVMAQDWISRQHVNRHLFHQMFVNAPNPNGPGMSATQAPTLIMWGKEDKLVHYTGAYTYQAIISHADVVIFDSVGHLPMLEIPIRTAKALQAFWS
jgi:abhydrolase domain-containing protein 6